MKQLALLVVLALAGCATAPQVVTRHEVQEVTKLVTEKCVRVEDIPPVPQSSMNPDGDVQQKAAGAVLDLHELDRYIEKLRALLHACAA